MGKPLFEPGRWISFSLSRDFRITSGLRDIRRLAPEATSEDISDFLDKDAAVVFRDSLTSLQPGAASADTYRAASGKTVEIVAFASPDGFTCTIRDTTPLMESFERLAAFYINFIHTPMAICFTDTNGLITDANDAFLRMYGYEIDEVRGRNPRILKSGRQSPAIYKSLWESITNRDIGYWSGELINRKKNGEEVYVFLSIASVFRDDGSLIGYVAGTIDLSYRKNMETALQSRNAELDSLNKFKSDMMAITSHDLKAPLNAIISYADMLKENLEEMPKEKVSEYLTKISEYGHHMTAFISDLLDLTKIESGKFRISTSRARLDAILKTCIEINEAAGLGRGVGIRLTRRGRMKPAVADLLKMEQVFNNLLSNAVKFSPDGGEIQVTFISGGGMVEIRIDDQGPGIPEEDLEAIFNQYYQVQKKGFAPKRLFGAGVGLSVVKSIVEMHGGTVKALNREGGGSSFVVNMPLKTFTSTRGLAAVIYDPAGKLFGILERTMRQKDVQCFSAANMTELRKLLDFESPDIFFTADSAVTDELMEIMRSAAETDSGLYFVRIQEEEHESKRIFFRTLTMPVLDVEISDILNEILIEKQRRPNF